VHTQILKSDENNAEAFAVRGVALFHSGDMVQGPPPTRAAASEGRILEHHTGRVLAAVHWRRLQRRLLSALRVGFAMLLQTCA
jgi:hypothetical protein